MAGCTAAWQLSAASTRLAQASRAAVLFRSCYPFCAKHAEPQFLRKVPRKVALGPVFPTAQRAADLGGWQRSPAACLWLALPPLSPFIVWILSLMLPPSAKNRMEMNYSAIAAAFLQLENR